MMNNILQRQALAYFLACALSISSFGQSKPGRNQEGYFGAVKSVRNESVQFSLEDGRLRRGKRKVGSIERFDQLGRLVEEVHLKDDGSILWSERNFYDSKGRLKETLLKRSRFVYLPDRQTYKYDARGNLIEEYGYDSGGKLVNTNEYVYDEKNRKVQWTSMSYHPEENSEPHKWTYSYDEQGNLREVRAFSDEGRGFQPTDTLGSPHRRLSAHKDGSEPLIILLFKTDGTFAGMSLTIYDRKGQPVRETEYDSDGAMKSKERYTYKYDGFGNWTQQNTYEWVKDKKGGRFQLSETNYQIINYFKR